MSTPGAIMDPGRAERRAEWRQVSRLIWGAALMLLGAGMLLERFDVLDLGPYKRYWPLLLVALGLGRLLTPSEGRRGGIWYLTAGLLLLAASLGLAPLRDSWPIFVVVLGASMMLDPSRRSRRRDDSEEAGHDA